MPKASDSSWFINSTKPTPGGRIQRLTEYIKQGNDQAAMDVAMFGKALSETEAMLWEMYWHTSQLERAIVIAKQFPASTPRVRQCRKRLKAIEDELCRIFLDAVRRHDGAKIVEIANAAWFLEGKMITGSPDRDRKRILLMRLLNFQNTDEGNTGYDIRQVEAFLRFNNIMRWKEIKMAADGFRATRRMCEEIGLRLKKPKK